MRNALPYPLNSRNLWHWCYHSGADSVMASAAETAKLGILSRPSGLSGDWKKTKAGSTDFGGYSSNDAAIWISQQRQHIRSLIMQLPYYARALGNVLYMPAGELSEPELMQVHNHLYRQIMRKLAELHPDMAPEKKAKVRDLIYCALCHYWQAISPAIEGGTPGSMEPGRGELERMMAGRGNRIETRYWSRTWRPLWLLIIDEIRTVDDEALKPLDKLCGDYFSKQEQRRIEEWERA